MKSLGSLHSATRTDDQTMAAIFWQSQPGGLYGGVMKQLSTRFGLSTAENARLYAMASLAAADGAIGCWNDKYYWNFWRPTDAIREAASDGNRKTEADPGWLPLFDTSVATTPPLTTPPFPDHPSGHSCVSGATLSAMQDFFGTDEIAFDIISTRFPVTPRHYDSFSDALNEVIDARVWGGIHFRTADEQGAELGKKVARWEKQHYFQPTAEAVRGGPPSLAWEPSTGGAFDYGLVGVGHESLQRFTLTNSGGSASAQLTVVLAGPAAFTVTADTCDGSLGPRKSCAVTVRFAPTGSGPSGPATLHASGVKAAANASVTLTGRSALQFVASGPGAPGLSGLNENPVRQSPATGTAVVFWDTTTSTMTVNVSFNNLTTPNTAAHIHCCVASPGNAGVATPTPTFTGFPSGITSGAYLHTFDMLNLSSYNPAFVTAHGGTAAAAAADLLTGLRAGQAYLNIHTTMFGSGEIRGFLQP